MMHHPTCRGECETLTRDGTKPDAWLACWGFDAGYTAGISEGRALERADAIGFFIIQSGEFRREGSVADSDTQLYAAGALVAGMHEGAAEKLRAINTAHAKTEGGDG